MAIYVTINIWQDILATNWPWHTISENYFGKEDSVQNRARKLLKQGILTVNYFGKQ